MFIMSFDINLKEMNMFLCQFKSIIGFIEVKFIIMIFRLIFNKFLQLFVVKWIK